MGCPGEFELMWESPVSVLKSRNNYEKSQLTEACMRGTGSYRRAPSKRMILSHLDFRKITLPWSDWAAETWGEGSWESVQYFFLRKQRLDLRQPLKKRYKDTDLSGIWFGQMGRITETTVIYYEYRADSQLCWLLPTTPPPRPPFQDLGFTASPEMASREQNHLPRVVSSWCRWPNQWLVATGVWDPVLSPQLGRVSLASKPCAGWTESLLEPQYKWPTLSAQWSPFFPPQCPFQEPPIKLLHINLDPRSAIGTASVKRGILSIGEAQGITQGPEHGLNVRHKDQ